MADEDTLIQRRGRRIVVASWVGIVGNGVLALLKTVAGVVSGSAAVLGDGIDSGLDVLTSGITLVAARITSRPPDVDHPYGHSRVETIATKSVSFIIFFAGAQLAFGTVGDLFARTPREIPSELAIWVTVVSIIGKSGLAIYKRIVGNRVNSSMLIADAKNMRGDIAVSVGVLVGLGFTILFDRPILDSIVALLISIWIMVVAFQIFMETNAELMEGFTDRTVYKDIFSAVRDIDEAEHPHRVRVRTIGPLKVVDLDIEVDGSLSVYEAHAIAQRVERTIKETVDDVYDVLVHVEPLGNFERSERYGVSQRKLDHEA